MKRNSSDYDGQTLSWLFSCLERCSLSPSMSADQMNNYVSMNSLLVELCIGSVLFSALGQVLYFEVLSRFNVPPRQSYHWFLFIGSCLIASSLFNQLASAFACRSVEVLEDVRFVSMILVQIGGFFVCVIFAYVLGAKSVLLSSRSL